MAAPLGWLLPGGFLLLFYFYPLAAIFQRSLAPDGAFDWDGVARVLATPYFANVLGFTVAQAALSTALTVLCGLPAAYVLSRWEFPGQALVRAVITVPFLLPTIVVALGFSIILGPAGWINTLLQQAFGLDEPPIKLLNTVWIIIVAHIYYNVSVVVRIVGNFWAHLDPQLESAAQMLGASRWRAFREVTLPLLAPALVAASLLVFVFDFTSFGVVLLLGGPRLATLEVEIYRQTVNLFDLPVAAVLSLVQIGVTFGLMALYARVQSALARPLRLRPQQITRRIPHTTGERAAIALTLGTLVVFVALPLVALAAQSVSTADGFGLRYYTELFVNRRNSVTYVPPIEAVWNSLAFAVLTIALALPLGTLSAQRLMQARWRWLDPVLMLPLATSAVTLGFGFILALGPPINLRSSAWLVPFAHALIAFPFVVRSVLPVLRSIRPNLREAARVLGASPAHAWRAVDLPIITRALVAGAVFTFTVSVGEFGATSLVGRPEMPTMPVAIFRLLGQPGALNSGQALALSTILVLVSISAIMLMERLRWEGADF
ncbi:MAG: iron ABC transporter permease [Chloroflexi bacterium]|nr:iron ABC transporter permease [Chloroflexota bacterium]